MISFVSDSGLYFTFFLLFIYGGIGFWSSNLHHFNQNLCYFLLGK